MRVSVVVPVYNEAEVLPVMHQRLGAVAASLPHEWEFIFVNDGSQDRSLAILKELRQRDPRVAIISLSRNFGHQTALTAGLSHARGDAVILMDADLQDPPEVLPDLIAKLSEGFDVVYAVRRTRKESAPKQAAYLLFYRLLAAMTKPSLPVDAGDFSILSKRAAGLLNGMPERTRFLRGLRGWIGLRQAALPYDRDRRHDGRSKYTLSQLMLLAANGVVAFSHAPLRLASLLGFVSAILCLAGILVFLYFRLFTSIFIPGWTSLAIIILFLGSAQLITIGILGEYVARIYEEVKRRPLYVVEELVGVPAAGRE
jgi:polyisoprenyl-phosphate glycosyltransferase